MTVERTGASSSVEASNNTSFGWTHTVPSDAEGLLVGVINADSVPAVINSIQWDAAGVDEDVPEEQTVANADHIRASLHLLIDPTVKTATITVTFASFEQEVAACADNIKGFDKTTPHGTIQTTTAPKNLNNDTSTMTVTSETGGLVYGLAGHQDQFIVADEVGMTEQEEEENVNTWVCMQLAHAAGATSVDIGWTSSGIRLGGYACIGIPLKAAAGGAVSGTAASTLPGIGQAAAGDVLVAGVAASSLPGSAQAAAGAVLVQGAAANVLPGIAQAAAGEVPVEGAAASALSSLAQAAAGIVGDPPVTGAAANTLPGIAQSITGNVPVLGTTASLLPLVAQQAAGQAIVAGPAASALPKFSQAAAGTVPVRGAAASLLPAISQAAAGGQVAEGSFPVHRYGATRAGTLGGNAQYTGVLTVKGSVS